MSKCIILSRVSTVGQSLESQTIKLKEEASRNGFSTKNQILIEHKESVVEHNEEDIIGLNELKDLVETRDDISCLFIYEISRLSRKAVVLYSMRDYLQAHKIQLICLTPYFRLFNDDFTTNQGADIIFALFTTLAEQEIRLKKERTQRGRERAMQLGKIISGHPLYGYKKTKDGYPVIDEVTSKNVIDMFTMYASGNYSALSIAKEMMSRGVFTKTLAGAKSCTTRILNDDHYVGKFPYPRILSDDLYNKVKELRAKKKTQPKVSIKHCYYCHNILYNTNGVKFSGDPGNGSYSIKKNGFGVSINLLDSLAWEVTKMRRIMFADKATDSQLDDLKKNVLLLESKIQNEEKKIEELDEQIQNIEIRIVRGKLSEKTGEALERSIENEKSIHNNQHKILLGELEHARNLLKLHESKYDNIYEELENITDENIRYKLVHEEIKSIVISKPESGHIVADFCFTINNEHSVFDLYPYIHKVYLSGVEFEMTLLERYKKVGDRYKANY